MADYEHRLTIVVNEDQIVAVHVDVGDSNIDGNLRIYQAGYLEARYEPDEWTHIHLLDVDVTPDAQA